MKKILGKPNQYYSQTNNAQVYLFDDYFKKKSSIACGPTSFIMGLDVSKWPLDIFAPGIQPEDSILMILHNPFNAEIFKSVRNIDYDVYPPNEIPQLYPAVAKMLYKNNKVCTFKWGITFNMIKYCINNDICLMVSGNFPVGGHFVLIVGYDNDKIIYNDPFKSQYKDNNGYNRVMDLDFFDNYIKPHGYRIEIYKNREAQ